MGITWSSPNTFWPRWNRNCGNIDHCTMPWTTRQLCSNNCCMKLKNSCRWACRSVHPDRDSHIACFHSSTDCYRSAAPLGRPRHPPLCTAFVYPCNCSGTPRLLYPELNIKYCVIFWNYSIFFLGRFDFVPLINGASRWTWYRFWSQYCPGEFLPHWVR